MEGKIKVMKELQSGSESFSIGSITVRFSSEGSMKNLGRDPSLVGFSVSGGVSLTSSESASSQISLRMQLATANKEAEDMRSFNAVLRKEHDGGIGKVVLLLTGGLC